MGVPDQRLWCCEHTRLGCAPSEQPTTQPPRWNCSVGGPATTSEIVAVWSSERSAWCCVREGIGCNGTAQQIAVIPAQKTRLKVAVDRARLRGGLYNCEPPHSRWAEPRKRWC